MKAAPTTQSPVVGGEGRKAIAAPRWTAETPPRLLHPHGKQRDVNCAPLPELSGKVRGSLQRPGSDCLQEGGSRVKSLYTRPSHHQPAGPEDAGSSQGFGTRVDGGAVTGQSATTPKPSRHPPTCSHPCPAPPNGSCGRPRRLPPKALTAARPAQPAHQTPAVHMGGERPKGQEKTY